MAWRPRSEANAGGHLTLLNTTFFDNQATPGLSLTRLANRATSMRCCAGGVRTMIERLRVLIERLGNPLDWPSPGKLLFITAFVVPPLLGLHLRARVLVGDPIAEPYVSRELLAHLLTASAWILVFLAASAALCLWLLRRGSESRALVHLVIQAWWLIFGWGTYIHGPATTPLLLLFPVLAVGTMTLFGIKTAVPGMLTGAALVLGATVAERFGYLPYAPYFEGLFPVTEGVVATEWIVSMTAFAAFSSAALIAESRDGRRAEADVRPIHVHRGHEDTARGSERHGARRVAAPRDDAADGSAGIQRVGRAAVSREGGFGAQRLLRGHGRRLPAPPRNHQRNHR
jgi:hypothetical protein